MSRRAFFAIFALLMAGCATPPPSPEPYTGPVSIVVDTTIPGDNGGRGTFFVLERFDGQGVKQSIGASLAVSRRYLNLVTLQRPVPSGRHRLTLLGRTMDIVPFSGIGGEWSYVLEGEIEADLGPGQRYRVNGALDAFRRQLWLEDATSGRIVSTKIEAPKLTPPTKGSAPRYTCCNLHYEGRWISDANWTTLPFVPAGTLVHLGQASRNRQDALVDGRPMVIGLDYGREAESLSQLVARFTVTEDPAPRIAAYPLAVRLAIQAGKVRRGMTREQVLVALGPPGISDTRSLDSSTWTYRTYRNQAVMIVFEGDALADVVATPEARSSALLPD